MDAKSEDAKVVGNTEKYAKQPNQQEDWCLDYLFAKIINTAKSVIQVRPRKMHMGMNITN